MDAKKIGIIILAAGASSRLGRPKQLLKLQNKTLICKTVETAIGSKLTNIAVVLGSNAERIKQEIENFPINICENKDWQSGMASSIKCGLENLSNYNVDAVIIMLCDQPLIKSRHINFLIETFENTNKEIIAAEYNNTIGVPALFAKSMFDVIMKVKGDTGAKHIIKNFPHLVEKVEMPEAKFDIDTFEDFENIRMSFESNT